MIDSKMQALQTWATHVMAMISGATSVTVLIKTVQRSLEFDITAFDKQETADNQMSHRYKHPSASRPSIYSDDINTSLARIGDVVNITQM